MTRVGSLGHRKKNVFFKPGLKVTGQTLSVMENSQPWYVSADVFNVYTELWTTRWRSWLRHCATSRKVAGSIPDGVTGIFH